MATTFDATEWLNSLTAGTGTGTVPYADMAGGVNQFMTGEALKPYLANLPNYAGMVGQRSANTGAMLKGELPQDVIAQIAQQSAERGIGGGVSGSPNANAAFLRAIGLSSLDLMDKGSKELSAGIADTPIPELWNPMSLHVPTVLGQQEQAAAIAGQNNAFQLAGSSQSSLRRSPPVYNNWMSSHMGSRW